jgi:hypothetical protein
MFRPGPKTQEPRSGAPMMSWWWERMSLHKDSNMSGLLPMLKLLKDQLDNMEPLRRSVVMTWRWALSQ